MPQVCRFTVATLTFSAILWLTLLIFLLLLLLAFPRRSSSVIDGEEAEDGIDSAAVVVVEVGSGSRLLVLPPWWTPSLTTPALLLLLSYPLLLLLPRPWAAAEDRGLFLRCIIGIVVAVEGGGCRMVAPPEAITIKFVESPLLLEKTFNTEDQREKVEGLR